VDSWLEKTPARTVDGRRLTIARPIAQSTSRAPASRRVAQQQQLMLSWRGPEHSQALGSEESPGRVRNAELGDMFVHDTDCDRNACSAYQRVVPSHVTLYDTLSGKRSGRPPREPSHISTSLPRPGLQHRADGVYRRPSQLTHFDNRYSEPRYTSGPVSRPTTQNRPVNRSPPRRFIVDGRRAGDHDSLTVRQSRLVADCHECQQVTTLLNSPVAQSNKGTTTSQDSYYECLRYEGQRGQQRSVGSKRLTWSCLMADFSTLLRRMCRLRITRQTHETSV